MPMLRWLDDDKARGNLTNVVMKILREDKALSYSGQDLQATNAVANPVRKTFSSMAITLMR